jgi:hypothetical protein
MARSLLSSLNACSTKVELNVELPQLRRGLAAQIGAQQVVAFAPARQTQLLLLEAEVEALFTDRLALAGQMNVH